MTPLVSICTITYCHAAYLAQTLDGFLAQLTSFPFEIIVHDDHSPDGTEEILLRYAQAHPDVIVPLTETENQYSKGLMMHETFLFPKVRGKYIALCEGDDLWIDSGKLQAQVDYMEKHPDCTFCFTNAYISDESGEKAKREFIPYYPSERPLYSAADRDYSLSEMARLTFIPTASFLFRTETLKHFLPTFLEEHCPYGDLCYKLYMTSAGYAHYMHRFSCLYRENTTTSVQTAWNLEERSKAFERSRSAAEMLKHVDEFSGGKAHDALSENRLRFLRVMAQKAPDIKTLLSAPVSEAYHTMSVGEKLRCLAPLLLPHKLYSALRKVRSGLKKGLA